MNRLDETRTPIPASFADEATLRTWVRTTAFGGTVTDLAFEAHRLLVVFRVFTSGMPSTEPIVFAERAGVWRRIMCLERHWAA